MNTIVTSPLFFINLNLLQEKTDTVNEAGNLKWNKPIAPRGNAFAFTTKDNIPLTLYSQFNTKQNVHAKNQSVQGYLP